MMCVLYVCACAHVNNKFFRIYQFAQIICSYEIFIYKIIMENIKYIYRKIIFNYLKNKRKSEREYFSIALQ